MTEKLAGDIPKPTEMCPKFSNASRNECAHARLFGEAANWKKEKKIFLVSWQFFFQNFSVKQLEIRIVQYASRVWCDVIFRKKIKLQITEICFTRTFFVSPPRFFPNCLRLLPARFMSFSSGKVG